MDEMDKRILQDDWTEIDDEIKKMMLGFPLLFPSRIECWIHLFGSRGTGYDWNFETGKLEYSIQESKIPTEPSLEEIKETDSIFVQKAKELTNLKRQFMWDNIDVFVKDYHFSTQEREPWGLWAVSWSDPDGQYFSPNQMQIACIHKEKISRLWRDEVAEFCKWIISWCRRHVYCPSEKGIKTYDEIREILSKAEYRKAKELYQTFDCAVRVLENIYTDEEKARIKQREEEADKMAKDIVKRILAKEQT